MSENQKITLYKGTIHIEFNHSNHRYLVNGKSGTPSVTSVTSLLNKPALLYWSANLGRDFLLERLKAGDNITEELINLAAKQHTLKKEKEATSGSLVHEWCERYIKGDKKLIRPSDDRVLNGVNAFLSWVETHNPKFIFSEKICYSKKHKYVGIIDCAFTLGIEKHKIKHIGDFKTSSGVYPEMIMQVSAYQGAEEEESGKEYGDKWIMRFDKDTGEFEAKSFPKEQQKDDFNAFLGLLETKKWLARQ